MENEKYSMPRLGKDNNVRYCYVRGSQLYNTAVEGSDIDYGGVFVCPEEDLMGLRARYKEQISDKKGDTTFYELGRWVELLLKGNPNCLESLFIPEDKIVMPPSDGVRHILRNRDMFITQAVLPQLVGYASSQVYKARGLNKKISSPVLESKDLLDFCYTFKGGGSVPIKEWLKEHDLKQKYCGMVSVPNMREAYALYYDFGAHIMEVRGLLEAEGALASLNTLKAPQPGSEDISPKGYRGMVLEDGTSNELRCSSVGIDDTPLCYVSCNIDAYSTYCKKYKEYKDWEKNRNELRYKSNLNKSYDGKNLMHCVRLLHMGIEMMRGEGLNVVRTWDRDILLSIRNHEREYDDIIAYVKDLVGKIDYLKTKGLIPERIDADRLNRVLMEAREMEYRK